MFDVTSELTSGDSSLNCDSLKVETEYRTIHYGLVLGLGQRNLTSHLSRSKCPQNFKTSVEPWSSLSVSRASVLFCFIDPRVRKIRNEASSCPGIFSGTLRYGRAARGGAKANAPEPAARHRGRTRVSQILTALCPVFSLFSEIGRLPPKI